MHYHYLIIGQGIAGTVLGYTLHRLGLRVLTVDNGAPFASSRVAAGLFNPVTGYRMTKTWQADTLFPFLHQFYTEFENFLGETFFHPLPMYRPFESVAQQNEVLAQAAEARFAPYVDLKADTNFYNSYVHHPHGGLVLRQTGYVDTVRMMQAWQKYLTNQGAYIADTFHESELELLPQGIGWQGHTAQCAIFCRGYHDAQSPYWQWLPFRPVKGEVLLMHFNGLDTGHIVNHGCWAVPQQGANSGPRLYKVGSNYDWKHLDTQPTEAARQEIGAKLAALIRPEGQWLGQQAGVRPATADRKPFVGRHPLHPQLAMFGGLGTKGVSLAPYFALQLARHLAEGQALEAAVEVRRAWPRT